MKSPARAAGTLALGLAVVVMLESPTALNAARTVPATLSASVRGIPVKPVSTPAVERRSHGTFSATAPRFPVATSIAPDALNGVIKKTCAGCHSDARKSGNLSLANFDLATASSATPEAPKR